MKDDVKDDVKDDMKDDVKDVTCKRQKRRLMKKKDREGRGCDGRLSGCQDGADDCPALPHRRPPLPSPSCSGRAPRGQGAFSIRVWQPQGCGYTALPSPPQRDGPSFRIHGAPSPEPDRLREEDNQENGSRKDKKTGRRGEMSSFRRKSLQTLRG